MRARRMNAVNEHARLVALIAVTFQLDPACVYAKWASHAR
jgi:hypothetical protein